MTMDIESINQELEDKSFVLQYKTEVIKALKSGIVSLSRAKARTMNSGNSIFLRFNREYTSLLITRFELQRVQLDLNIELPNPLHESFKEELNRELEKLIEKYQVKLLDMVKDHEDDLVDFDSTVDQYQKVASENYGKNNPPAGFE